MLLKKEHPNSNIICKFTNICAKCDLLIAEILIKLRSNTAKTIMEVHHRKDEKTRKIMKPDITSASYK